MSDTPRQRAFTTALWFLIGVASSFIVVLYSNGNALAAVAVLMALCIPP